MTVVLHSHYLVMVTYLRMCGDARVNRATALVFGRKYHTCNYAQCVLYMCVMYVQYVYMYSIHSVYVLYVCV